MRTALAKGGPDEGAKKLYCGICGTEDYDALVVHKLGLCVGMSGDDYSFCKTCWGSKSLGKDLLTMLGFKDGAMLLEEECITISEVSQ